MQTQDELREHFEIERELADRLRDAPSRQERRALYAEVYRLRSTLIPHHPLVVRAGDPGAQDAAALHHVKLLRHFVGSTTVFCELGAGDAAVSRMIAKMVRRAVALDVTNALAPKDGGGDGFEFRTFDGFDLGIDPGTVDVAYSNDVVEHLHPDDMLDHCRAVVEVLRPEGIYLCITPNRISGPHDISRHFSDVPLGFHLREYSVGDLKDAFLEAGFARVKIVLSWGGRRLSPLLPAATIAPLEKTLEALPRSLRIPLGRPLPAVKVVAIK